MNEFNRKINFSGLVDVIRQVHDELAAHAGRAVNISLTLRNWMFGLYIAEYELRGEDRAVYGESLLGSLVEELAKNGISTCGKRQLYNYLRFYQTYPQIGRSAISQLQVALPQGFMCDDKKVRSVPALLKIEAKKLVNSLSYTHYLQKINVKERT